MPWLTGRTGRSCRQPDWRASLPTNRSKSSLCLPWSASRICRCLKERFGRDFRHYEHSLRIADHLERDGAGLNLTAQVRDGIARHSSARAAAGHARGEDRRVIDRVAYINHDIDDAVRAGLLREEGAARPSR